MSRFPALDELLEQADEFRIRCRQTGSTAWFRGHGRADWKLKSTLHRHIDSFIAHLAEPVGPDDRLDLLRNEEKSIYRKFISEAWPVLKADQRSTWGSLFTMQHHGLPTRLLDWTESLACALFFAQRDRASGEPATIWMLNPNELNNIAFGRRAVVHLDDRAESQGVCFDDWHPQQNAPRDLHSIAAAPVFINERMTAQRSAFVLGGESFDPLDKEFSGRLVDEGYLVRIDLEPDSHEEIDRYLGLIGVTAFTVFPDLEGLALKHRSGVERTIREVRKWFPEHFAESDE